MIHLSQKAGTPIPEKLQTEGAAATQSLKDRYDAGERNFGGKADFDSSIYGHKTVKEALIIAQHDKCCFCESKISAISHGDVEHYRPKAGWVQADEPLNEPGYYWLAYDWDNLLLSCQICNQRYKKNYFPLADITGRMVSHHDSVAAEVPLFIHPALEDPEQHIRFEYEMPLPVSGSAKGRETIRHTGLDRPALIEKRLSVLSPIRNLYLLAQSIPVTNPEINQWAREMVNEYVQKSMADDIEFAAMLRSFFRKHPVDF